MPTTLSQSIADETSLEIGLGSMYTPESPEKRAIRDKVYSATIKIKKDFDLLFPARTSDLLDIHQLLHENEHRFAHLLYCLEQALHNQEIFIQNVFKDATSHLRKISTQETFPYVYEYNRWRTSVLLEFDRFAQIYSDKLVELLKADEKDVCDEEHTVRGIAQEVQGQVEANISK